MLSFYHKDYYRAEPGGHAPSQDEFAGLLGQMIAAPEAGNGAQSALCAGAGLRPSMSGAQTVITLKDFWTLR